MEAAATATATATTMAATALSFTETDRILTIAMPRWCMVVVPHAPLVFLPPWKSVIIPSFTVCLLHVSVNYGTHALTDCSMFVGVYRRLSVVPRCYRCCNGLRIIARIILV